MKGALGVSLFLLTAASINPSVISADDDIDIQMEEGSAWSAYRNSLSSESGTNTFRAELSKGSFAIELPTGWALDPEESDWDANFQDDLILFSFKTNNAQQEFDIFVEPLEEPMGLEKYVFEELLSFNDDDDIEGAVLTTFQGLSFRRANILGIDMLCTRTNVIEEDQDATIKKYAGCTYMFVYGPCAYNFALASFEDDLSVLDDILQGILQSLSFQRNQSETES